MAEGLLHARGGSPLLSCVQEPDPRTVHPLAIGAMHEIGIDISHHRAKSLEEFREHPQSIW